MITLAVGATSVTLHPDLLWSDEFAWSAVEQTATRTITGALVVQAAPRLSGRPVTLESAENVAWMPLTTVSQLRNWADLPGCEMQLTLRGVTRTVAFRHQDGAGLEAAPVVQYQDTQPDDLYRATLRLMEI